MTSLALKMFTQAYLHLPFEVILKDTVEFLHIVLHKALQRIPSERSSQLCGAHGVGAGSELIEYALKCKRHRLGGFVLVGGDFEYRFAEKVGEEQ